MLFVLLVLPEYVMLLLAHITTEHCYVKDGQHNLINILKDAW